MSLHSMIFTPLFALSLLFFFWSLYRRLSLIALGQPTNRFVGFGTGLRDMFIYAFGQKRVLRKLSGLNHLIFFWSFMALLLANGSMSSNTGGEGEIRKALLEADLVECMVALPGQLFTNTQIPACIWFLTKNKKQRRDFRDRITRDGL